jgi:MSHA biogenesis protein MshN
MSLINQMLKDLEKRRSHPGSVQQQEVLLDVQVVPDLEPCSGPRPMTVVLSALLLVLLGGLGWWGYNFRVSPRVVVEAPVVVESHENTKNPENNVSQVSPDSQNSYDSQVSPVPQVVTQSVPQPQPQPELEIPIPPLVVVPPNVAPVAAVVAVTKVDRSPTPQEQAEASFQRALAASKAGERATIETELRLALQQDPSHLRARETLAVYYYRAHRLEEAKKILHAGITANSAPLPLRKSLARILLDQGDQEAAAKVLLQGGAPPVAQEPEFHQLLGAIYQRAGEYSAAAQTYRQLLTVQRNNGIWWLGLALALESERSLPDAIKAYQRALEDPALSQKLGDFARSRLTVLGSSQL